jgi:sec-independent protein translocase protein TatB
MSFSDTVFLFFLALILFGPKKLPEMARQAGRLLAELRRASNEFKSQIETEIAHLETEKARTEKTPTILPPSLPPQGTVASLTSNTAGQTVTGEIEPPISVDAAAREVISDQATLAGPNPPASPSSAVLEETVVEPRAPPTSQESHV